MPVRICSWEQTAAKFTAVPPASPGQAGFATPVTKQPTPQRVGWLKGSCRVKYKLFLRAREALTHADFTVFTKSGHGLNR